MSLNQFSLLHFLDRMPMYISPIGRETIVSFMHGYEEGVNNKFITTALKSRMTKTYKTYSSSDGWPAQMNRLSEELNLSWVETFEKITREIIEEKEY